MSEKPSIPAGAPTVFLLRRETAAAVLAGITRMTPKVAANWLDFGDRGRLGLRRWVGGDGTTVALGIARADDPEAAPPPEDGSHPTAPSDSVPVPVPPPGSESSSPGPGPSAGTESSSGTSSGGSSGGSKASMAIVPAAGRWLSWVVRESPEATFEDCLEVPLAEGRGEVDLPQIFLASVEPGSPRVIAALPDAGLATAAVWGGKIVARGWRASAVRVTVSGVRLGHAGRWRRFTAAEAAANDFFYGVARELTLL